MILKCKICGGDLNIEENNKTATCEYCGNKQTVPKISSEQKTDVYERANHFRMNNEYDKAIAIYETILNEDNADSDVHWQLVLCDYGVEYVKDRKTNAYIPTCNRTKAESVFENNHYKEAIKYADDEQKKLYETEAKKIDNIQKRSLEIAKKEEPFDIFISYKETDENGNRTEDSVIAHDLYNSLTKQGYKVFFSKITLENKLGREYEPYIFSALSSSKIMIVVATKKEYVESAWVKNEWSRFLGLAKEDENKVLIPTYKGMNPYDLPKEFAHLQAVDLGKIGVIEDLKKTIDTRLNKNLKDKVKGAIDYKKRKKPIIITLVILAILILVGLGIFITNKFFLSEINYKKAEKYMNEEKYEEAIKEFEKLEGYKDSNSKIIDCNVKIRDQKKEAVSKYIGQYDQTEKYINEFNGYEEYSGDILEITKVTGNEIEFTLGTYGHRVAEIRETARIKGDIYEFSFSDSWMNKGKGTLKLLEDKIQINIEITERDEMANFGIREGEYTFYLSEKEDTRNDLAHTNVENIKEKQNTYKAEQETIDADIQNSKNKDNRLSHVMRIYVDRRSYEIDSQIQALVRKHYGKSYIYEKNLCIYEDESESIEYIISARILNYNDLYKDISKLNGIIKTEDLSISLEDYINM